MSIASSWILISPRLLYLTFSRLLIQVQKYLSITEKDDIAWALIRTALSSVAQTAIIPIQDVLRLGNSARMNIPATQVSVPSYSNLLTVIKLSIKYLSWMPFRHFNASSFIFDYNENGTTGVFSSPHFFILWFYTISICAVLEKKTLHSIGNFILKKNVNNV